MVAARPRANYPWHVDNAVCVTSYYNTPTVVEQTYTTVLTSTAPGAASEVTQYVPRHAREHRRQRHPRHRDQHALLLRPRSGTR